MKKINILFVLVFLIAVSYSGYGQRLHPPVPATGAMAQHGMAGMCQHRLMMWL